MNQILNLLDLLDLLANATARITTVTLIAVLCLTVFLSAGCDLGTYNKRLKEPKSTPSSEVESGESESDDNDSVDDERP